MYNPVIISNLALALIGEARVNSLTPPRTSVERTVAEHYPQVRDRELSIRRWVFATTVTRLTLVREVPEELRYDRFKYEYDVPGDCLRVLRDKYSDWSIRGRKLYASSPKQVITYIQRKPEGDFDAMFVDVLSKALARVLVEPVTQSNEKWNKTQQLYREAVNEAGRLNAFVLEPDNVQLLDQHSEWLDAREAGPFV